MFGMCMHMWMCSLCAACLYMWRNIACTHSSHKHTCAELGDLFFIMHWLNSNRAQKYSLAELSGLFWARAFKLLLQRCMLSCAAVL